MTCPDHLWCLPVTFCLSRGLYLLTQRQWLIYFLSFFFKVCSASNWANLLCTIQFSPSPFFFLCELELAFLTQMSLWSTSELDFWNELLSDILCPTKSNLFFISRPSFLRGWNKSDSAGWKPSLFFFSHGKAQIFRDLVGLQYQPPCLRKSPFTLLFKGVSAKCKNM